MYNNFSGGYGNYVAPNYQGAYMNSNQTAFVPNKILGVNYASEEEMRGYMLNPNSQILALDKEQPFFYIKTADNLGRSTFTKCKYEEVKEDGAISVAYLTKEDIKDMATRDELQDLQKKLEAILQRINGGVKREQQRNNSDVQYDV